jgi:hypothetical protein
MATELNLGYAFVDPASVLVTVDDAHPVGNKLTLVITNRSGAAVQFQNPQGLTTSSELPAWNDQASPLGRVSVWFPWGDASGDLSRVGDANKIVASSRVEGWAASDRMTDPTLGVYWTLFPLSKSVFLEQDASISFEFTGIVSHVGTRGRLPEQSWMTALPRVPDYTSQKSQTAVWKRELSAKLTAPAAAIPGDDLELSWTSAGAEYCSLSPGAFDGLDPVGKMRVKMPERPSVTYTLSAHPATGAPVTDRKTVSAQTGWMELGTAPVTPDQGLSVFRVGSEYLAVNRTHGDVWSSPDGRVWSQRGSLATPIWSSFIASDGIGRAWIMGQDIPDGVPSHTAVIATTTDGRSWDVRKGAPWGAISSPAGVFFQGALWILGGWDHGGQGPETRNTTIWSSTDGGATWKDVARAPWTGAVSSGAVATFAGWLWATVDGRELWATPNGREWARQQPLPWSDAEYVALEGTDHALYGVYGNWANNVFKHVMWTMNRDQRWKQIDFTPAAATGIWPGVAPYGTGLLVVGPRSFRWVPPAEAEA